MQSIRIITILPYLYYHCFDNLQNYKERKQTEINNAATLIKLATILLYNTIIKHKNT